MGIIDRIDQRINENAPQPSRIALEPCEDNPDGDSLTIYYNDTNVTEEQVGNWLCGLSREGRRQQMEDLGIDIWADTKSPYFSVSRTETQPFPGHVRFQANPMR